MSHMLHSFVHSEDTLARLQEHARRLQQAQRLLHQQLPPYLREHCSIANLKDGTLVIQAHSGAIAAKLRQAVPSLQGGLMRAGLPLREIRIKVGVTLPPPPPRPVPAREMAASSIAHLQELLESLPAEDPLRAALARLIQHSRSRSH